MNATRQLHEMGQSLWLDNITRTMLDDGSLAKIIKDLSVTGLTSNPSIFDAAFSGTDAYDAGIREKTQAGKSGEALFVELALEDLRRAADLFKPVFLATEGIDGWVSMEVSPLLAGDTAGTIKAAKLIHAQADRPNLFVKIPGTPEGIPAIEEAIFSGVPVNVTLLFSREQYLAAAEAYLRGIERRLAAGLDPKVASVASIFVSRWDKAVTDLATERERQQLSTEIARNTARREEVAGVDPNIAAAAGLFLGEAALGVQGEMPPELHDRLGIAISQRVYRAYRELLESKRWHHLAAAGARPQRLLWASTGTKDPKASDTLYVEALAAPETINTMPEKTLRAFADHGHLKGPMPVFGSDHTDAVLTRFAQAGVDIDALALKLQQDGAKAFVKSWQALLGGIAEKSQTLSDSKAEKV